MKRTFLFLMTALLLGCSAAPEGSYMEQNGKKKVLSTTAMINDLVGFVGAGEIDHVSLIQGDIDPHSYELVKGDGEKIQRADLVFYNGLGLEHGASVTHQLEKHQCAIALGDIVFKDQSERFLYVDGQIDPHIWMDIALFAEVVDPIVDALSLVDPDHRALFFERGEELKKKMEAKDQELKLKMQSVPASKRFLVTSHDAFHYFAKRYLSEQNEVDWERRLIAPEGLAPDGQMGMLDIKEVSDFLCAHKLDVVFPESNINTDSLKKIVAVCKERGLVVRIAHAPLYGDTMGGEGGVHSHLEMIDHNVQTLVENLGGNGGH